jgi:hypothetical protein
MVIPEPQRLGPLFPQSHFAISYRGNFASAAAMCSTVGAPYLARWSCARAGDVVRHSLAYPNSVGDLLEHVTPSVSAELRLSGAGERICETSLLLVLVLPEMHPADCFKNIE